MHSHRSVISRRNVNPKDVKLPTINLPEFSGNYDQWVTFYNTFTGLINNNSKLLDIQKFHYLRSSLKGEAAEVIQDLDISPENYEVAWDLLKETFENTPRIVNNHLKTMFDLEPIKKESHPLLQQLLTTSLKHMRALKALKQPTEYWDTIVIYLVASKLDSMTRREWEDHKSKLADFPTMKEFSMFLTKKIHLLEATKSDTKLKSQSSPSVKSTHVSAVNSSTQTCKFCKQSHILQQCEQFLKLNISDRINEIAKLRLCKNCLRFNHSTKDCMAQGRCRTCNQKHNTLLHLMKPSEGGQQQPEASSAGTSNLGATSNSKQVTASSIGLNSTSNSTHHVLLPTALVDVFDLHGNRISCRVLLDSASQSNFITQRLFDKLNMKGMKVNFPITGINNSSSKVVRQATIKFASKYNSFKCTVTCLILPSITQQLPQQIIDMKGTSILSDLQLADPTFNETSSIDALLGAEVFWSLMCIGQISLGNQLTIAQKTHFGWIVSGPATASGTYLSTMKNNVNCCTTISIDGTLQDQLTKFWTLEEVQTEDSPANHLCETIFTNTTTRASDGRFIVHLPFKPEVKQLGESYDIAQRRFLQLEKRLTNDSSLKQAYSEFLSEYQQLGHMTRVQYSQEDKSQAFFLPHHAVLKPDSTTTKIRVVFDGSCKTTTGVSLNDVLMVGPTIQPELFYILIRFRMQKIAFTSDCEKMYRQVLIHPDHRIYQNILWRENTSDELTCFQLNTITYGTSSAPFLATRCLLQVALENEDTYPDASYLIKNCFYVDDLIASLDTTENALLLINQVNNLLATYGFPLRKWTSNAPSILQGVSNKTSKINFSDDGNKTVKTLGLRWNSDSDVLQFPVNLDTASDKVTKRSILSTISKIFDPLGLVGPITITAKIILQRLWQLNITWDESLPQDLHSLWLTFKKDLELVTQFNIPRQILCDNPVSIQLHAFADASEKSYGTCIYLRSTDVHGQHFINLLCAKSRVAPIKIVTVPRLELCASSLLAKLVTQVLKELHVSIDKCYFWTDSTIVLCWLRKPPNELKTFVGNRVAQITSVTQVDQWHHVRTFDNPADIISRGTTPKKLSESQLWFQGPPWLTNDESSWPIQTQIEIDNLPEVKPIKTTLVVVEDKTLVAQMISAHSNLTTLQRVIAYCARFIKNCRTPLEMREYGPLKISELSAAMKRLIQTVQESEFSQEIKEIKTNKLSKRSSLLSLRPFLDDNNILRVGGRIKHSNVTFNQKHPAILPKKHELVTLIIRCVHLKHQHIGAQATLSILRLNYWPISGLSTVKRILRKCTTCQRLSQRPMEPVMGDLPKSRVLPSRPFSECGTDFAGPFLIRDSVRSRNSRKCYLCIFICFATKAVHLELVSSLSTDAFIACLKRFIARRGVCQTIHSDNGTNYVGANNQIKEWYELSAKIKHNDIIASFLGKFSITWKFIPARSPHFGGLWESTIKSAKRHLYKVMGTSVLTYEELQTLFCQIESTLNSRPLVPLTNLPDDYNFLTPAHFLIGDSLFALPEPSLADYKLNRLNRYQLIQRIQEDFWKRWSMDYLTTLQVRTKWQHERATTLRVGTLVLLRDSTPPLLWRRGCIIQLHPGPDGIVRVATVKTSSGEVKRAITKLCILCSD